MSQSLRPLVEHVTRYVRAIAAIAPIAAVGSICQIGPVYMYRIMLCVMMFFVDWWGKYIDDDTLEEQKGTLQKHVPQQARHHDLAIVPEYLRREGERSEECLLLTLPWTAILIFFMKHTTGRVASWSIKKLLIISDRTYTVVVDIQATILPYKWILYNIYQRRMHNS